MQKSRKKDKKKGGDSWADIRLGGFRAQFPKPRLPRLLGAVTNLPAGVSVYPHVKLDVPIVQQTFLIVAGALAASMPIDVTLIQAFATRFATLFREYAVVGLTVEVQCNNIATTSGRAAIFIDETTAGAPTAAQALGRPRLDLAVGPLFTPNAPKVSWVPQDIVDLDYFSTSAPGTSTAWLKIYTDVANFGTQAATTGQIIVTGALALEYRGYV
jgi:hypothetical protein